MKTVMHLVKNSNMLEGGIKTVINNFVTNDTLKSCFNMFIADPFEVNQKADVFIWHENFDHKNLLQLINLKLKYKDSKFIIVQHHTTKGFYDYYEAESRLGIKTKISYLINYLGYLIANQVVCVSNAQATWLTSPLIKDKVRVINPSEPLAKFFHVKSKCIENKLILGCYGRAHPQKGFSGLIKAVSNLPNIELYIQLLQGPLLQELLELIKNTPNVHLYKYYDDIPKFISLCDVIVIPSVWEPFGLVALEAKASGKPIIVSNVDGLTEQSKNYGYTFEADSLKKLMGNLNNSFNSKELLSMGSAARKSVKDNWSECILAWRNLLNE